MQDWRRRWWAGVGERDCGSQVPECVGSSTIQTASAEIPGKAVAVAARRDGVWVLRAHRLERWYAQPMSSPVLLDQAALSGEARDLMVGGGIGLLASDAGLQSVTARGGPEAERAVVACGRPLRIADLGSGRFAVSTTLGIAIVEASEEGVSLKSMTGLVPGADDGEELAMGTDAATIAACRAADAFLPGWFADSIAEFSPIAAIGRDWVLAGRMGLLLTSTSTTSSSASRDQGGAVPGRAAGRRGQPAWLYDHAGGRQGANPDL